MRLAPSGACRAQHPQAPVEPTARHPQASPIPACAEERSAISGAHLSARRSPVNATATPSATFLAPFRDPDALGAPFCDPDALGHHFATVSLCLFSLFDTPLHHTTDIIFSGVRARRTRRRAPTALGVAGLRLWSLPFFARASRRPSSRSSKQPWR